MPIQWIPCPACGTENSARATDAAITCDSCGAEITIGAPVAPPGPVRRSGDPMRRRAAASAPTAPPQKPATGTKALLVGLVVTIVGAAAAWALLRSGPPTPGAAPQPPPPSAEAPAGAPSPTTHGSSNATPAQPASKPLADDPAARIAAIRNAAPGDGAARHWNITNMLRDEAVAWRARGAPEDACKALDTACESALIDTLRENPNHLDARTRHGDVKLEPLTADFDDRDARYLSSNEEKALLAELERLTQAAERSRGWVSKAQFDAVAGPLMKKSAERRTTADAYFATDLGAKARREEIEKRAVLDRFAPSHKRWRIVHSEPYVLFIEESPKWDEIQKAQELVAHLRALSAAFMKEFGDALKLTVPKKPINVACFVDRKAFHEYLRGQKAERPPTEGDPPPGGKPGTESAPAEVSSVEAHFEPSNNMLVVHGECAVGTILHEGTHQLVHVCTPRPLPPHADSFWFQEGIAEWFGGSRVVKNADGTTTYEVGVLQEDDFTDQGTVGRLTMLALVPAKARFSLQSRRRS